MNTDRKLLSINIILAIGDTLIAALTICAFGWGAWFFGKWWLLLFCIIPLGMYSQHTLIIDADLEAAKGERE